MVGLSRWYGTIFYFITKNYNLSVKYELVGKIRMVDLLKKWGYYIGDENGKKNWKTNALDCVLFTVYFILSMWNSMSVNPSKTVFILNTISIGRLILKNYIEQCKIVSETSEENQEDGPLKITAIHLLKIMVEITSLVLLLGSALWNSWSGTMENAITYTMMVVLIITWFENLLCMIERLYDAHPKQLSTYSPK